MPETLESVEPVEPVEALRSIFEETAEAVARAQSRLDGDLGRDFLARCQAEGHALHYSIPHVSVELEFGLRVVGEDRVLIFLRRGGREELHGHRLTFSLVAAPEPPPPLDAAPGGFPFYLSEPHFMLPPEEELRCFTQLLVALTEPARRVSMLPASSGGLKPEKLRREIKELVKAFLRDGGDGARLLASAPEGGGLFSELVGEAVREAAGDGDTNAERGLVYFRLDTAPASYLVARVTKKSRNDSLFVLTPEGPGGATRADVYSVEGDDTPSVRYRPLHLLGLALRHWLEGARPPFVRLEGGPPDVSGLANLKAFALNLREGYARGMAALAARPGAREGGAAYDLSGVLAELTYTVDYEKSDGGGETNPHLNFQQKVGDDEFKLIESRAYVRAERVGASARMAVELAAPEFALSGAARERFLRYFFPFRAGGPARRILRDIRSEIGEREAERYEGFVATESYRRSVVVLLSYRGNTPKDQFLVIWPGTNREGRPRSFAFTCEPEDGGEELKLTRWVLGVDEGLDEVMLDTSADPAADGAAPAADKNLSQEQYQAFHNFFHAVRIWRTRVRKG